MEEEESTDSGVICTKQWKQKHSGERVAVSHIRSCSYWHLCLQKHPVTLTTTGGWGCHGDLHGDRISRCLVQSELHSAVLLGLLLRLRCCCWSLQRCVTPPSCLCRTQLGLFVERVPGHNRHKFLQISLPTIIYLAAFIV